MTVVGAIVTAGTAVTAGLAVLLVLMAGCAIVRPWSRLPRPSGPCAVGTVAIRIRDAERSRTLHVRLWYPARPDAGQKLEPLWDDLRISHETPWLLRILGRILSLKKTNSWRAATFRGPEARVLIYNHGLVSFASENTLLMESLASCGFIVLAVQHLDQVGEYREVVRGAGSGGTSELQLRLAGDMSRAERARLSLQLYEAATGTAELVARRARDTRFLLDRLNEVITVVPRLEETEIDVSSVGVLGLSLGGAVASRVATSDPRVVAVANLDGGLYGADSEKRVAVPYLMIYSEQNVGSNDLRLMEERPGLVSEATIPGSRHLDFHDASAVLPILRVFGALGRDLSSDSNRAWRDAVREHFLRAMGPADCLTPECSVLGEARQGLEDDPDALPV